MNAIMEHMLEIILIAICLGAGIWSWWMDNGPVRGNQAKEQSDPDAEDDGDDSDDDDDMAQEEEDT